MKSENEIISLKKDKQNLLEMCEDTQRELLRLQEAKVGAESERVNLGSVTSVDVNKVIEALQVNLVVTS
jgi:hypothetical protein